MANGQRRGGWLRRVAVVALGAQAIGSLVVLLLVVPALSYAAWGSTAIAVSQAVWDLESAGVISIDAAAFSRKFGDVPLSEPPTGYDLARAAFYPVLQGRTGDSMAWVASVTALASLATATVGVVALWTQGRRLDA